MKPPGLDSPFVRSLGQREAERRQLERLLTWSVALAVAAVCGWVAFFLAVLCF